LADSLEKGIIDMTPGDADKVAHDAMEACTREHNIPVIIDAADMVHNPDKLSALTYLSYFQSRFNEYRRTRAYAGESWGSGPVWETSGGDVIGI
jgi:hypothetical protein